MPDFPACVKLNILANSRQMAGRLESKDIYSRSAIRNVSVVFGSVFSNFHVRRYKKDGSIDKSASTLVPISYSAKEAYSLWMAEAMRMPDASSEVNVKLPRLSFEMTGLAASPDRGMNVNVPIHGRSVSPAGSVVKSRSPVAYSFEFTLTLWAKTMDESIQILDQILPMFAPEVSVKIKESFGINLVNDVKIVLGSVSKGDTYQTMLENRIINWDLSFTVYANILPPRTDEMSLVQDVISDLVHENLAKPGIQVSRKVPTTAHGGVYGESVREEI